MRRTVALVAGTLIALASVREARATATLVSGLGGPAGYGPSCMPPNDDGSWPNDTTGLDLTPAFPKGLHFYSGSYTTAWVNNNGNVSFQAALPTFTPNAFPGAPEPMIAPFWADIDTRTAKECNDQNNYPDGDPDGYPAGAMCTSGPDYSAAPASNGVWWSLTPGQMVVTWDHVGVYECHATPVMTFQMILTSAGCGATAADGGVSGIDFDIEFRYNECGWEAGDASGGTNGFCPAGSVASGDCTPAQAGFDSAETPDNDYASLPMSLMEGISTELCNQSNLTPPQAGVWRFSVRGGAVECPNAGAPCATGQQGICAAGALQCTAAGATTCVPLTGAQPSQCNGLDNDCNGAIDTGPCPVADVCVGAQCVPSCEGETGNCAAGNTCANGVCIETDCVGVVCPAGERCSGGACVDSCSGIVCPLGQVCRFGTCVDPCLGLNCGMGEVCQNGTCVPTCQCNPCASAQTCTMSGLCVETDCATVSCPAGQTCESGACVDECTGAVCPPNQICQTGMCVPHVASDDAGPGVVLQGPDAGAVFPGGTGGAAR